METWEFNVAGAPVLVTGVRGLGPAGYNGPLAVNAVRGPTLASACRLSPVACRRPPAACRLRCVAPPRGAAPEAPPPRATAAPTAAQTPARHP